MVIVMKKLIHEMEASKVVRKVEKVENSELIINPCSKITTFEFDEEGKQVRKDRFLIHPKINALSNDNLDVKLDKISLEVVANLTRNADLLGKTDLSKYYYQIPVVASSWKYLCFKFDDVIYQFTTLCFGLSVAVFIASYLTNCIADSIRSGGHETIVFIDDFF